MQINCYKYTDRTAHSTCYLTHQTVTAQRLSHQKMLSIWRVIKLVKTSILSGSRHEVMLVSQTTVDDMATLKEMVEQINMEQVCAADKLSDHVYQYNSETRQFIWAATIFNISQMEEKELPELAMELQGDVTDYNKLMEILREVSHIPIRYETITNGTNGYP